MMKYSVSLLAVCLLGGGAVAEGTVSRCPPIGPFRCVGPSIPGVPVPVAPVPPFRLVGWYPEIAEIPNAGVHLYQLHPDGRLTILSQEAERLGVATLASELQLPAGGLYEIDAEAMGGFLADWIRDDAPSALYYLRID